MFKGFGSWLGLEAETCPKTAADQEELNVGQEEKVVEAQNEVNKQQPADGEPEGNQENPENPEHGQGLSDFIFSFATSATKKISDSMVETAQTIKKTVEEGKIDGIIDKTFLGDFQKEQEKFVSEKKAKKSEAAVPPWVGYNEEETIQQQILALSADKRNFLRDPPAGVQFYFDMEHMYPLAAVMLEEDQLLNRMRFDLVPKHVKEEAFWRNYFYRVSLIKQSAQLTALAAQQQKDGEDRAVSVSPEDVVLTDNVRPKTPPASCDVEVRDLSLIETREEEEMCASEEFESEFMSTFASNSPPFNDETFEKAMEQLALDTAERDAAAEARNAEWEKEHGPLDDGLDDDEDKPADWEKELEKELQEYDVMPDAEDDPLDDDLEKMLRAYNNNDS